jgi:hypothetical protein
VLWQINKKAGQGEFIKILITKGGKVSASFGKRDEAELANI